MRALLWKALAAVAGAGAGFVAVALMVVITLLLLAWFDQVHLNNLRTLQERHWCDPDPQECG